MRNWYVTAIINPKIDNPIPTKAILRLSDFLPRIPSPIPARLLIIPQIGIRAAQRLMIPKETDARAIYLW
jgi:hypothetical protein